MATTETSKRAPVKVGTTEIITEVKITDKGANNYTLDVIRYSPTKPNEPGVVIAQTDSTGKLNPTSAATTEERAAVQDTNSQLRSSITGQKKSLESKFGIDTPQEKSAFDKVGGGSGNKAGPQGTEDKGTSDADKKEFKEENDSFREGTREQYRDARYPLDLALEHQDCIRFTILKYKPSLEGGKGSQSGPGRVVTVSNGNPIIANSTRLGTITFPIPAGINDSNSVNWQQDEINDLQEALGNAVTKYIVGGTEAAAGAVSEAGKQATDAIQSGDAQKSLAAKFGGAAVGTDRLQQRVFGSMFNNNLELLFTGPSLRSFSFTFKLSPRNPSEAKEIMTIIRFFKQSMSVKRSKSSLLLKTPHTFAISYISSNKQHPYLNKFKECALTSCSVDYAPEGQYMTYMSSNIDERSMISYNLSLTFQELEPVFDDEYGNESPQSILNVGY